MCACVCVCVCVCVCACVHLNVLPPQLPLHSSSTSLEMPGIHIEALCRRYTRRGGEGRGGEVRGGGGRDKAKCDVDRQGGRSKLHEVRDTIQQGKFAKEIL